MAALTGAPAQAEPADRFPQVWLSPGIYAWHFDSSKNLRNDNWGPGVEVALTDDHLVMGGSYMNSNWARSHYAAYQWRPLHWMPGGIKVGAGILLGAFDGYPNYQDGGWFVAPLPVLSVEGRYVGANFSVIPTISNRLDGAFAIQLKFRVW